MITELEGINKQWGRGGGCELEAGALGGDEEDEARPPTFRVHKRWDFPGRASSGSPTRRQVRREPICHLPARYVTPQRPQVISSSRTIIGKNYSLHLQMRQLRAKGEEMTCSKSHLP